MAEKYSYKLVDSSERENLNTKSVIPSSDNIWIFQANPTRYDILNALTDDKIGNEIHWLVNQHKKDILKGHIGIIWLSGKESGIYAVTEIITNPQIMAEPEPEKKYWTDPSDKADDKLRVKMRIVRNLIGNPITKESIKYTNGLGNLSILRCSQGTNFSVTPDEWDKIKTMIKD